jgi:glycosyltransferase involved in cell wall biosynthesis
MPTIGLNAHLLSLRASYRGAGISHYIQQLLCHLPVADPGLRYALFAQAAPGPMARTCRYESILPTERPLVRILWEQFFQPWLVWRAGCDLLHGLAYALPLGNRVPAVVTVYDLSFMRTPEHFRSYNRVYLRLATSMAVRRAQMVCAISEHTRQDLIERFKLDPTRIGIVYPGCDERFRPPPPAEVAEFRRRQGLPDQFILYLGTLEPRKNIPLLLQAYANLKCPQHLVIGGDKGWHYAEIFSTVERLGLQDRVHFPGYIPQADQPLWYAAAMLFVYPSRYEGFGLPPLEAMACGTPTITSNAASLPEVVGDAGFTVSPDDVVGLTESLQQLLTRSELRENCREGGLAQASRFRWPESARAQVQLYHNILAPARERRA